MRIVCHQCSTSVNISLPNYRCPECSSDLRGQMQREAGPFILPDDDVRGYYRQAAELALAKKDRDALAVIDQGLTYFNATELHLLAAILHRRRNEYEQMRRHVASIPVEDSLRGEAEWLLRSHQEQQRLLRQAATNPGRPHTIKRHPTADNPADQFLMAEFGATAPPTPPRNRGYVQRTMFLFLLTLIFVAGWQSPRLLGWAETWIAQANQWAGSGEAIANPAEGNAPQVAGQTPIAVPTPLLTPTTVPTPLPTDTPLPNMVTLPTAAITPEAVAVGGPPSTLIALIANDRQIFDWATHLLSVGRPDLSNTNVRVSRQGGKLILEGVVTSTEQRTTLLAIATAVPGVDNVDGIDLLVRLPETYTVRENDTLWTIALELYGDGTRWQSLLDANRDLLTNATLLSPGQQLVVPPP